MCGRYYIDDETAREMERIVRGLDTRLPELSPSPKADVYPAQRGTVIRAREGKCEVQSMKWGFRGFRKRESSLTPVLREFWKRECFRRVQETGGALCRPEDFTSGTGQRIR